MKEESSETTRPGCKGEREEDVHPYLAASLEQEKGGEKKREDRPSIVGAYVQLFAAEYGGDTEEDSEGEEM